MCGGGAAKRGGGAQAGGRTTRNDEADRGVSSPGRPVPRPPLPPPHTKRRGWGFGRSPHRSNPRGSPLRSTSRSRCLVSSLLPSRFIQPSAPAQPPQGFPRPPVTSLPLRTRRVCLSPALLGRVVQPGTPASPPRHRMHAPGSPRRRPLLVTPRLLPFSYLSSSALRLDIVPVLARESSSAGTSDRRGSSKETHRLRIQKRPARPVRWHPQARQAGRIPHLALQEAHPFADSATQGAHRGPGVEVAPEEAGYRSPVPETREFPLRAAGPSGSTPGWWRGSSSVAPAAGPAARPRGLRLQASAPRRWRSGAPGETRRGRMPLLSARRRPRRARPRRGRGGPP